MKTLLFAFITIVGITIPASVGATTWYVANTGSDSNSCTQAQSSSTAKLTLGAALACVGSAGTEAGAGHTIEVGTGTYTESIVDRLPSGSSWTSPFVFRCTISRSCTVAPGNRIALGFNAGSHYIEIRGFIFDGRNNNSASAMYFSSATLGGHHHIRIVDNEVKNMGDMGIQASGASNFEFLQNSVHDVGKVCGTLGVGYCHGLYVSDNTSGWLIDGNLVYNAAAYGIHLYGSNLSNHTIRNNITRNNGTPGVNGSGIIVGGSGMQVYRNISYSNADSGIQLSYSGCNTAIVYNNSTWNNAGYGIYNSCSNTIIRNNLVIDDKQGGISGTATSNNITSRSAPSYFVNPTGGNFNLVSGSTAIDAGTAGISTSPNVTITSFSGVAPDVGALESNSNMQGIIPPAPTSLSIIN